MLPRYRAMVDLERANFGVGQITNLLLLSEFQVEAYRRTWATELPRHLRSIVLDVARCCEPTGHVIVSDRRLTFRLMIGSGFRSDRSRKQRDSIEL
jgi:hypothetical protein